MLVRVVHTLSARMHARNILNCGSICLRIFVMLFDDYSGCDLCDAKNNPRCSTCHAFEMHSTARAHFGVCRQNGGWWLGWGMAESVSDCSKRHSLKYEHLYIHWYAHTHKNTSQEECLSDLNCAPELSVRSALCLRMRYYVASYKHTYISKGRAVRNMDTGICTQVAEIWRLARVARINCVNVWRGYWYHVLAIDTTLECNCGDKRVHIREYCYLPCKQNQTVALLRAICRRHFAQHSDISHAVWNNYARIYYRVSISVNNVTLTQHRI